MNAKEHKIAVLSELQEIQKMCISEVEEMTGEKFAEFSGDVDMFFRQCWRDLPENWQIKTGQAEINFPSDQVCSVLAGVRKNYPQTEPKHTGSGYIRKSLSAAQYQREVENMRQLYKTEPEKVKRLSEKSDLIRLCWKYISDPNEVEGVHFAWINPVVKCHVIENSEEHLAFAKNPFAEIIETVNVKKIPIRENGNSRAIYGYKYELI